MKPFIHQEKAVDFILSRGGSGGIMFDIGLGKTWTALMVYERLKEKNTHLKLLVVCPLSLLTHTWIDHIKRLYPQLTYCNLRDEKHWKECDVSVINFESLIRNKSLEAVDVLISHGDWMCVIDESSKMKDHKSLTTKTLIYLRQKFKHRIVMSGTPAPNTELEYWSQLEFIERGSLHPSFFAFRNSYFYLADSKGKPLQAIQSREGMSQMFKRGARYVPIKGKQEELMKRIGKYCIFAKKEDCLKDLPEAVEQIRDVELNQEERKAYKEMKRHLVAEIEKEKVSANNALTKLLKLREITSGFIINDQKQNIPIQTTSSSKMNVLKDLINEIGSEQAIIWGHFSWEIDQIVRTLFDMGKTVATLYGKTVDRDESIKRFKECSVQFLVAHPLSGGHGLNLQHCHICIYYSINYSHEEMVQSAGRIHRNGQMEKCLFVYLLAKDTIDQDIWEILNKKKNAVQILEGYLK